MTATLVASDTRHRTPDLSRAWWPVGLAVLIIGWGGNQFTPLLIAYHQHAGYSQLDVDVFLGAYVLGLAPGLLVAAALSDHLGRRPVLVAGLVSSVLGSLMLALGDGLGYPALFLGRTLSGISVGVAMAVGTAWVTELSRAPYSPGVAAGTGARRATILLTAGFALGPASAGVLAQWASPALVWPYVVHIALAAPVLWLVAARSVETRHEDDGLRLLDRLRIPAVAHRRFLRVVVPMAPWIFGSAAVAYAVVPQVVADPLGSWALLGTVGLTVATLLTGVAVQPIARRLDDHSTARAVVVSMILMTAGMALAAATARTGDVWLALPVALVLGAAYGIAVVSGLLEVQRLAPADQLSGLTGVYYALAYVGFLLPAALAALGHWFALPTMLVVVALLAVVCTAICWSGWSRHLPTGGDRV